ncbi:metalloprotease [Streptomyces sp. NPDC050504]|uniref:metalloprotease n=1 Tax=Streptomyces sp. NPDC050504 TaxID=3365618 RepID=UPI0037ADFE4A
MTAAGAAALGAYCPELRASVLLSEALLHGADTVHLVKDTASGQSFKLGAKEHFLVSRMDGGHSLEEIGAQYAARFGRRLGDAHWQRLLRMLGTRGLLVGSPEPAPPAPEPVTRGLLRGTLPLVADADATAARLHRALGFLLAPRWTVPLLALVVAMEAVLALHAGELTVAAWELFANPVLLAATGALLWTSTALHELAHGVVARHYGGKVTEIGLRWRLPVVIMYCTVDNYLYLRGRRGRIATALAGAVMNLLFLLPFCALWLFAPLNGATRDGLAGLLFLGSVQALAMLLPVPPLDGYKVVGQALRITELAASSREYLKLRRRGDPAAAAYPRRARVAYTAYGIGWPLALCLPLAAAAAVAHHLLTR